MLKLLLLIGGQDFGESGVNFFLQILQFFSLFSSQIQFVLQEWGKHLTGLGPSTGSTWPTATWPTTTWPTAAWTTAAWTTAWAATTWAACAWATRATSSAGTTLSAASRSRGGFFVQGGGQFVLGDGSIVIGIGTLKQRLQSRIRDLGLGQFTIAIGIEGHQSP